MKCFVHGPYCNASLERLGTRNKEIRTLTEDALNLAPSRTESLHIVQDLNIVQECASGLHDALQAGWKCDCSQLHPANIKLDIWSPRAEGATDKSRLKFSFLFADDAQNAHHEHWMTAECAPSKTGTDRLPPLDFGSPARMLAGKSHSMRSTMSTDVP